MRHRVLVLVAAALFFAFAVGRVGVRVLWPTTTAAPTPSDALLVCQNPSFDFGTKFVGATVEHVFSLHNPGNADLVISEVRPGCSCTTTDLQEKVIRPGASVPLRVNVSLESQRGDVEFHVAVTANEPEQFSIALVLKGHVDSEFAIKPIAFGFGETIQGQALAGSIEIEATGNTQFQLLSVECESPYCRAGYETVEPGRRYRVSLLVSESLPPGFWKSSVIVKTDNPKEPMIKVTAAARVKPLERLDSDKSKAQGEAQPSVGSKEGESHD